MDQLAAVLEEQPMQPHQRVLALTFMHGSRRRLESRLASIEALGGRYEAVVLDGFAWRLVQRWRRLVAHLGHPQPQEHDFNACCALAAQLVGDPAVAAWVKASFPIMLVDEAQDLCANRCAIVTALSRAVTVLLAYDEFQCLQPELRPVPIQVWLQEHAPPTVLQGNQRTNSVRLLAAAAAVRQGTALDGGAGEFRIFATHSVALTATRLALAIRYRGDNGTVAVLTPSRTELVEGAVARVGEGPIGQQQSGPYNVRWESSDAQELAAIWARIELAGECQVAEVVAAMHEARDDPILLSARDWLKNKERTQGLTVIGADEVRRHVERLVIRRRQFGTRRQPRFSAMTIHQAKNREFDHVVVIWPFQVPTGDDQRRRLLYNAITRARRRCTVLVQSDQLLAGPPFIAAQAD